MVGAGSSGVQIADELNRAGKKVYLSVGAHDRPPRAYRNRDFCWWLGVLGQWDAEEVAAGPRARDHRRERCPRRPDRRLPSPGQRGHHPHRPDQGLCRRQGDLPGRPGGESESAATRTTSALLDAADAYIERNGLDLPLEPEARKVYADAECIRHPIQELNLADAGITAIIWATGYAVDFNWLQVDAFDDKGKPKHQRGVSREPGVYFIGLPWLSRRGSTFIWGVWHDAKHVADHIATQRRYVEYQDASQREGSVPKAASWE